MDALFVVLLIHKTGKATGLTPYLKRNGSFRVVASV